jgi:peptide/nickel transport system permease protein
MSASTVNLREAPSVSVPVRSIRARSHAVAARYAGIALVGGVLVLSLVVPLVGPPPDNFVAKPFLPPSWSHLFGTDEYGREVFVRTFAAGRVDLFIAAAGVVTSLVFGTALGIAAAIGKRRFWETALMRLVDAILAFPFIVFVLALVMIFGATRSYGPLPAGMPALLVAIFVWHWAIYARLARGETLVLRNKDFVTAARLAGFSQFRIMGWHVMPIVVRAAAAYAITDALIVLITTAGLPFLGAGVQPPTPEWGAIMYDGRTYLAFAWWISILPGVILAVTGIGLSLFGDSFLSTSPRRSR